MKKRIFIAIPSLNIGGAESALIGMLQALDYSKVDVDLFPYAHVGPLLSLIPKSVHVLEEKKEYALLYRGTFVDCLLAGCPRLAWAKLKVRLRMKMYVIRYHPKTYDAVFSFAGDEYGRVLPSLYGFGEYDLAISFVDPHKYVLDNVLAKKTIGWIHTDYTKIDINKKLEYPVWKRLNKIVAISDDVGCAFAKVFPGLAGKLVTIENIISPRFIRLRGDEYCPAEYKQFLRDGTAILCSVGRICSEKNYESIPAIARILKEKGCRFHWYIVGPGSPEPIIFQAKEYGVEDLISFIGPRKNPLPYIKNCFVYVHPSLREGKSIAVREAQILCKPVIITNFSTAHSHIKDGKDGMIVPLDKLEIAEGIVALIDDKAKRTEIAEYLARHNYGNEQEIDKIYQLAGVE